MRQRLIGVNIGIDLGWSNDRTALVVATMFERMQAPSNESINRAVRRAGARAGRLTLNEAIQRAAAQGREYVYRLESAVTWPYGIPIDDQATRLCHILDEIARLIGQQVRQDMAQPDDPTYPVSERPIKRTVFVDRTGLGLPIAAEFKKTILADARYSDVRMHGVGLVGGEKPYSQVTETVSKLELVSKLASVMAAHRLIIPKTITGFKPLRDEIANYQQRTSQNGTQTFGNAGGANNHDDIVIAACLAVLYTPPPPAHNTDIALFPQTNQEAFEHSSASEQSRLETDDRFQGYLEHPWALPSTVVRGMPEAQADACYAAHEAHMPMPWIPSTCQARLRTCGGIESGRSKGSSSCITHYNADSG